MARMSDRDAAFLWETEALRESTRRGDVADRPAAAPPTQPNWATLREAHYLTGIPIETLRKWARRGSVASFLDESEVGVRRMVRMDAVRARAEELGRPIAPIAPPPVNRPSPRPAADRAAPAVPAPEPVVLSSPAPAEPAATPEADPPQPTAEPTPAAPEGTMIVPIAAWDKMLMQLGNLHEAGQQLAEARERAAKAETESKFLRERLGELRRDLLESRAAGPPREPEAQPERETEPIADREPEAPPVEDPPLHPVGSRPPEKLWRYVYRGWRERRR